MTIRYDRRDGKSYALIELPARDKRAVRIRVARLGVWRHFYWSKQHGRRMRMMRAKVSLCELSLAIAA